MPRAFGYNAAAFTAGTEVPVNAATYNEPAAATPLSIKSASANDAAAGTGVRTIKVTYYTLDASGNILGPFTYTATLNGTTAVQIDAANAIRLIDKVEALTVGSGGVAAGAISLFPSTDGTGTAIVALAAGDRRTYIGHAYVPTGRRLFVDDIQVESGEVATVQTQFNLRSTSYPLANVADKALTATLAAQGLVGTRSLGPPTPLAVVQGPARVQLYATPGNTASASVRAEFGYHYA
jgi:hypothetical protein